MFLSLQTSLSSLYFRNLRFLQLTVTSLYLAHCFDYRSTWVTDDYWLCAVVVNHDVFAVRMLAGFELIIFFPPLYPCFFGVSFPCCPQWFHSCAALITLNGRSSTLMIGFTLLVLLDHLSRPASLAICSAICCLKDSRSADVAGRSGALQIGFTIYYDIS